MTVWRTLADARQFLIAVPVSASILIASPGCAASRIGGTFIAHGDRFVNMLQLTESQEGQITGVFSTVELTNDGSIHSGDVSITSGTLDDNQLTLHFSQLAIFGENIAGTLNGSGIRLESSGSDGSVMTWYFQRGSLEEFRTYANRLKGEGDAITFDSQLKNVTQGIRQTDSNATAWISNAELHAQRIPKVKEYYQQLEDRMRSLVDRERRTPDAVTRTQISVAVIQANVVGMQSDLNVNQTWDQTIISNGQDLARLFASYPSDCGNAAQFQRRGANRQTADEWQSACQEGRSERARFEPEFADIEKQRADLKSFQASAASRRQGLVDEASRIQ